LLVLSFWLFVKERGKKIDFCGVGRFRWAGFLALGVDDRWQQFLLGAGSGVLYGIVVACGIDRESGGKTAALHEII